MFWSLLLLSSSTSSSQAFDSWTVKRSKQDRPSLAFGVHHNDDDGAAAADAIYIF
jgi:hypothetical protein